MRVQGFLVQYLWLYVSPEAKVSLVKVRAQIDVNFDGHKEMFN
jgi:hypothetical protein